MSSQIALSTRGVVTAPPVDRLNWPAKSFGGGTCGDFANLEEAGMVSAERETDAESFRFERPGWDDTSALIE